MKKQSNGFTLIELVVVIVILGILAVTAAPKFLNFSDDAHESAAQGSFGAFASALQLYKSQWLIDGEPSDRAVEGYANDVLFASDEGFPIGDTAGVTGEGCGEIWNNLLDSDLTTAAFGANIFPSLVDVKYWYTGDNKCIYYYIGTHKNKTTPIELPQLTYDPATGSAIFEHNTPSS